MTASPDVLALLNAYQDPAVLINLNADVLAANSSYIKLFKPSQPTDVSRHKTPPFHYTLPCDLSGKICPNPDSLNSTVPVRGVRFLTTKEGKQQIEVELRPVKNTQHEIIAYLEVIKRIRLCSATPELDGFVGKDPVFLKMLEQIHRVATHNTAVLLQGETGTGKEMAALAIHQASARSDKPFIVVECSGLTESLFESELFGHEKGAFTGAINQKAGLVAAAEGGTLFLDEICDVPVNLQIKLLRLLETGFYRPVGNVNSKQANFRLICATNRDLKAMVENNEFRQDLYYRISAFPVQLPALRERKSDIAILASALLARLDETRQVSLQQDAIKKLKNYSFPGNIRQLRNILERACIISEQKIIRAEHIVIDDKTQEKDNLVNKIISLDKNEQNYLNRVSHSFKGERRQLALLLGISERTLYRKLEQLEISKKH